MCNCRRRKKCFCLNNPNNHDKNELETLCNNVPTSPQDSFNTNCSCGFENEDNGFPDNPMYAQSYVPMQVMNETFMPCSGLHKGTIFPELVSEYCPGQSMAQIQYLMDTNPIKGGCNG